MNTPETKGQPVSATVKRVTKEVRMVMTGDQVREALTSYLTKKFPQFRNMEVDFEFFDEESFEIEATAIRETEEKQ